MPKINTNKRKREQRHYSKQRGSKSKPIGAKPFNGYKDLRKNELRELKKLTLQESIRQTELLLREVTKWKK